MQAIGKRTLEKVCHTDGRKIKRGGRDDGNGWHEKTGASAAISFSSIDQLEMRGYPLVIMVDA